MPSLHLLRQPEHRRFVVFSRRLRLGRDARNDLVLDDSEIHPFHALIERGREGEYCICGLVPGASLRLDGRPVQRARLTDGDVLELGQLQLQFRQPKRAVAREW